jgi:hypothetical protein
MNGTEIFLQHAMELGMMAILVGLFFRHRAHLCWSFVAYLVTGLVCNSLMTFWPEQFFRLWFSSLMLDLLTAMKLAIAAELAYRTFRALPERRRVASSGPVFFVPVLFIAGARGRQLPGDHPDHHPSSRPASSGSSRPSRC